MAALEISRGQCFRRRIAVAVFPLSPFVGEISFENRARGCIVLPFMLRSTYRSLVFFVLPTPCASEPGGVLISVLYTDGKPERKLRGTISGYNVPAQRL